MPRESSDSTRYSNSDDRYNRRDRSNRDDRLKKRDYRSPPRNKYRNRSRSPKQSSYRQRTRSRSLSPPRWRRRAKSRSPSPYNNRTSKSHHKNRSPLQSRRKRSTRSRSRSRSISNTRKRYDSTSRSRSVSKTKRSRSRSVSFQRSGENGTRYEQIKTNVDIENIKNSPSNNCEKNDLHYFKTEVVSQEEEENYEMDFDEPIDKEKIYKETEEKLRLALAKEGKVYPPPKPEASHPVFANDGSFLEVFKKMQEQVNKSQQLDKVNKTSIPICKRRGGKILKTGIVEKPKVESGSAQVDPKDFWSIYLQEVKKYKNASCDIDSKTRPLVK